MIFLSSNHFSTDIQIADAVSYLRGENDQALLDKFTAEFPEYDGLTWSGSWVDTEASEVPLDYTSWVADWIEANTPIYWHDGEPVIAEENDETEEDEL